MTKRQRITIDVDIEVGRNSEIDQVVDTQYTTLEKKNYSFHVESKVCVNTWAQVDKLIGFMYENKLDLKNLQPKYDREEFNR